MRVIFHIDLNAFFANVEVLQNPSLANKPIAVANHHRRSVISTASYEARRFGVHAAMPVYEALQRCRELIIVPAHFDLYEHYSQRFFQLLMKYTDQLEIASIDECYLDVTEVIQRYEKPLDLAIEMQKRIHDDIGLSCSIGVAPNKFLAKMASDMKKPMGITVLRLREVRTKLWPLPIGAMYGIGKKTAPRLYDVGIHTIGDLANAANNLQVRKLLGKNYLIFCQLANGLDDTPVQTDRQPSKSIGQSSTLDQDTTDYEELRRLLHHLSQSVAKRAQQSHLVGDQITLTIRYQGFINLHRSMKIDESSQDSEVILNTALLLFDAHYNGAPIRLLGISLGGLKNVQQPSKQLDLFHYHLVEQDQSSQKLIYETNKKLGAQHVFTAATLLLKKKEGRR